jgi:hypothetical protein
LKQMELTMSIQDIEMSFESKRLQQINITEPLHVAIIREKNRRGPQSRITQSVNFDALRMCRV